VSQDKLLNVRQAAERLALSKSTLDRLRCYGGGPVYKKLGRSVRYAKSALASWAATKDRASTSDMESAS